MRKQALGGQELEILRFVSDHAPVSVGEVAQHFGTSQGLARTTILTVMERLRKKGYLNRAREGDVFRYSPSVEKEQVLKGLVRGFVEDTLAGSLSPFVAYLAEARNLSEDEIESLRQLVGGIPAVESCEDRGTDS